MYCTRAVQKFVFNDQVNHFAFRVNFDKQSFKYEVHV